MNRLQKYLRQLRESRQLTMREVASAINVPLTTYREWEYGRAVKGEHVGKLASFFGISTEDLLGQNEITTLSIEQRLDRALNDLIIVRSEILRNSQKK